MEDILIDTNFADDKGEVMVVVLKGYIDQTNSFGLQKTFNDILNSGCYKIIVDFSKVMYISSAGWGIFVGEIKRFRDEGGDIKLANMTPDIYEVYQMLEFFHIFEDFNSVENALESFDKESIKKSVKLPNSGKQEETFTFDVEETLKNNVISINPDDESSEIELTIKEELIDAKNSSKEISVNNSRQSKQAFKKPEEPQVIELSKIPLGEKLKKIVAQYPLLGILQIRKLLKDERFGNEKIGLFKLYRLLKSLDLESKDKRYRYYRSC